MESDPPDESTGPTAIIQKAKASMRDSPVKLADLALPSLGALGSVALSDGHDWPGEWGHWCAWKCSGSDVMQLDSNSSAQ